MATLNLTTEEFADVVMLFMANKAINPDEVVTGNEEFNEFFKRHGSKIKAALMKYYLDSKSQRRVDYKRIKNVFTGKDKNIQQIRIGPSKEIEKVEKGGIVSKTIKKIIKKVLLKQGIEQEEENLLNEWIEGEEDKWEN